ncbi:MAG TPA: PhzF family phenazine biosynthesis protein, partial [Pyrinomonadaceae bacterium]|nr:PhzF family phenazine biosynthesis protein [Pyrinomonadaceae bacterium]
APDELLKGLGGKPREVLRSRDYLLVYVSEAEVRSLNPDMNLLTKLDSLGIIVTAAGDDCDFVSRFFAPGAGIDEDPVTGSAHCTLIPYWSKKLGKQQMHARQVSPRGGELFCEDMGERVKLSGHAVRYSEGFLYLGQMAE